MNQLYIHIAILQVALLPWSLQRFSSLLLSLCLHSISYIFLSSNLAILLNILITSVYISHFPFLAVLGLCCCTWTLSSCDEWGLLSSCGVQTPHCSGLPSSAVVKNVPTNTGDAKDVGSIPGSGRSPGVGNGNPGILAWKIPWAEETGGLQPMGSQRI